MLNKLASSFILASAIIGTMIAPSYADDDTFKSIVFFPIRVAGLGAGTLVGVPMGAIKDGWKGAASSSKWVAGKTGKENCTCSTIFGGIVGGPVGALGGSAYGVFDGSWHGLKTGYDKPFSKDSFTFKDE